MKRNLGQVQRRRLVPLLTLVLFGLAAAPPQTHANSEPFSHVPVFGDSLSDTGNLYQLSGGLPPAPYWNGRFCNGPVWVEYLVAGLRMNYQPDDNFAVAGATTGTANTNDGPGQKYPGLQDEIALFKDDGGVTEPERALFIVGAGGNDIFVGVQTGGLGSVITEGVNNTLVAVQELWGAGARYILVMNLPDLGVTPRAQSMRLGAPLTELCATYNDYLDLGLDGLATAGIPTIRLDAFTLLHNLAHAPAEYGFSDVTTPLIGLGAVDHPDQFLFWDTIHPTTAVHEVLAKEALRQLISTFSPSKGLGQPDAGVNALHGLVNAGGLSN
jgi:phospholipase/lecithinase/hemolysin